MIDIAVKIPGLERRRRSIGLLHIVAGFFLIANAQTVYQIFKLNSYLPLLPLFLAAAISLVYGFLRKKLDPLSKYNFFVRLMQALVFFGLALLFVQAGSSVKSIGLFMWVLITGSLAFTERMALQAPVVSFTEPCFIYPNGYTRKQISWKAIADVTLRPDFLTIHYPDNRFLQFELQQPLSESETEYVQDFCRRHVKGLVSQA